MNLTLLGAAAPAPESSDFRIAMIGLLGVLVGAGIGLVGVFIQTIHAASVARRSAMTATYSTFLRSVDELGTALLRYKSALEANDGEETETTRRLHAEKQEAYARADAEHSQINLVSPRDTESCAFGYLAYTSSGDEQSSDYFVYFVLAARRDAHPSVFSRLRARIELRTWKFREGKSWDPYSALAEERLEPTR